MNLISAIFLSFFPLLIDGHGYMSEPVSRNWYSQTDGLSWRNAAGLPDKEYCPHCLNRNRGVCGLSESGKDYDNWLDSQGNPMPFLQLGSYEAGQVIDVVTTLTANHGGHMQLAGCPNGEAPTQDCFDSYVFEFVEDSTSFGLPKDTAHPERGYYGGGAGNNGIEFAMKFKIPDNLVGEKVVLQWLYVTANSCLPEGYLEYLNGGNESGKPVNGAYFNPTLAPCAKYGPQYMPLAPEASSSGVFEQFVNCADVSISGKAGSVNPETLPTPVIPAIPVTPAPINTAISPPIATPTQAPVVVQTVAPIASPTSIEDKGTFCCSYDFKTCNVSGWCGSSKSNCEGCQASWILQGECTGKALWEKCNDDSDCCGDASCEGNQWYKQCM